MNGDEHLPQSFSLARRWGAGLNLVITVATVLAIVAMVNYLGMRHFSRLRIPTATDTELSKRTRLVLASLTNTIKVISFFNTSDDLLYPRVRSLLKEYENASGGKIVVRHVDYLRDFAEATAIKTQYRLQMPLGNKDVIIFDSGTRSKIVNAADLSDYDYSKLVKGETNEVQRTHFKGELLFTSAIFSVGSQRSPKAYFLIGHDEHSPEDTAKETGYSSFAAILRDENNIDYGLLDLFTNKDVPTDCSVLIIAAPKQTIPDEQIDKIQRYLEQGGRMLALFNYFTVASRRPTGLERLLEKWGVEVDQSVVLDPPNAALASGADPRPVTPGSHPIVSSLGNSRVHFYMPRSIHAVNSTSRREDVKVEELLFTGPASRSMTEISINGQAKVQAVPPQPLCAAVERSIPALDRGSTRIVVIGDSSFLFNQWIEVDANHDFAAATMNWLVQQNVLLNEIPRRALRHYQLSITQSEQRNSRLLLLLGMPASILAVGFIVWLRRRN